MMNAERSQLLVSKKCKVDLVNIQVQTKSIEGDRPDDNACAGDGHTHRRIVNLLQTKLVR
jgi:hypothetical protein